jgi:hypothetical protein
VLIDLQLNKAKLQIELEKTKDLLKQAKLE